MDQRTDRSRALHRVRQPYVQGELAGFSNCAAENQKGDESCARAKHGKTCAFKTTAPAIIEEQCATAIVEPEHPEKKSHVADARGKECRNGHCKHRDLSGDCQYGRTFAPGARQTQSQERSRKGHRREEPEIT